MPMLQKTVGGRGRGKRGKKRGGGTADRSRSCSVEEEKRKEGEERRKQEQERKEKEQERKEKEQERKKKERQRREEEEEERKEAEEQERREEDQERLRQEEEIVIEESGEEEDEEMGRKTGKGKSKGNKGKSAAPRRKQNRPKFPFTDEQEGELVEWLQGHEILYNKGHKGNKNADQKKRLYEEQAVKYEGCSGDQIKMFLDGLRTHYGKITKGQSGTGFVAKLSERKRWIYNSLHFLSAHIVRTKSKSSVNMS
jgi:hypothetical protein